MEPIVYISYENHQGTSRNFQNIALKLASHGILPCLWSEQL